MDPTGHIARLPVSPCARANGIPGAISAIVMKLLAKSAGTFQTGNGLALRTFDHCLSASETHDKSNHGFTRRLRRAGPASWSVRELYGR